LRIMRPATGLRRLGRAVGIALAACVGYAVLHVLLALYPRPLFAHQVSYKNFVVHMREEIPPEITGVLDRAETRLATSALYDPAERHHVYIYNSRRLVRFLMLRDVHFGANLPNGTTIIVDADVARDVARCERLGPRDERRRTLTESIVHEIVHALIRDHVGWSAERKVPSWIKEGYCEHVARGSAIDPERGMSLLLSGRGRSVPGFPNFRSRKMVEYLIDKRGLSIDELLARPPDFDETLAALLSTVPRSESGR